jgi:hypothetical protein
MPGGSAAPFLNYQFTRSDERLGEQCSKGYAPSPSTSVGDYAS